MSAAPFPPPHVCERELLRAPGGATVSRLGGLGHSTSTVVLDGGSGETAWTDHCVHAEAFRPLLAGLCERDKDQLVRECPLWHEDPSLSALALRVRWRLWVELPHPVGCDCPWAVAQVCEGVVTPSSRSVGIEPAGV